MSVGGLSGVCRGYRKIISLTKSVVVGGCRGYLFLRTSSTESKPYVRIRTIWRNPRQPRHPRQNPGKRWARGERHANQPIDRHVRDAPERPRRRYTSHDRQEAPLAPCNRPGALGLTRSPNMAEAYTGIRPIETNYAGCRFRSRLEARFERGEWG